MKGFYLAAAMLAALVLPARADNSKVLIDSANNISVGEWKVTSAEWGGGDKWSVQMRTLHGGQQEGVQIIEVDNGAVRFTIVPTRGFEVWRADVGGLRLGWDSPVKEIRHPSLVNLAENGGRGWVTGFGGWMVRAGISSFGEPGPDGNTMLTQHGRIDYIPAHFASVRYDAGRLVIRGIVDDTRVFGSQLRLTTDISVTIGRPDITFDDSITNLSDVPQEMQVLYHINFGTPLMGKGAEFIAPVQEVAPINAASAVHGLKDWNRYEGPHMADYSAQVFLLKLAADAQGDTAAMLKSPDGTQAALLKFNIHGLPVMSLWKNETSPLGGYVTGLEPGTSYPNHRSVERQQGRVPVLKPGESWPIHLTATGLTSKAQVDAAAAMIRRLAPEGPTIRTAPPAP
jgi:hypothetical protein